MDRCVSSLQNTDSTGSGRRDNDSSSCGALRYLYPVVCWLVTAAPTSSPNSTVSSCTRALEDVSCCLAADTAAAQKKRICRGMWHYFSSSSGKLNCWKSSPASLLMRFLCMAAVSAQLREQLLLQRHPATVQVVILHQPTPPPPPLPP